MSASNNSNSSGDQDHDRHDQSRRKLRVLVISMPDSERRQHIEEMFQHPQLVKNFEPPEFSDGVPQRSLRNRYTFFKTCFRAGLIPPDEWKAIDQKQQETIESGTTNTDNFFDCLKDIPIQQPRRGSQNDIKLHYSVELWRKAKTINRGRAVLGCTLAHLIALKKFTTENFDILVEDNIRITIGENNATDGAADTAAERIWKANEIGDATTLDGGDDDEGGSSSCHLRFFGWLGSIPNLEWILTRHIPKKSIRRPNENNDGEDTTTSFSVVPFPKTQDILQDLEENGELVGMNSSEENPNTEQQQQSPTIADEPNNNNNANLSGPQKIHTKPGGTPVWGSYAYWMSKKGYETLLCRLQQDVGALLWKGKRGRYYHVKPADKILPRTLMEANLGVQLTTYPCFFRAPMLTSKIHTAYDPEFCKSTQYQLQQCGNLSWNDLWLTNEEKEIVQYKEETGEWITLGKLREMNKDE